MTIKQVIKALDKDIHRYYTKLGMKIPEQELYQSTAIASHVSTIMTMGMGVIPSIIGMGLVTLNGAIGSATTAVSVHQLIHRPSIEDEKVLYP
ncbi:hypothetical protein K8R33_04700, partial [archaeon]|nr:hypothetical protein [archaeon]